VQLRRRQHVVCFIDDDPNELTRFEEAMREHFTCVTSTSYEGCLKKLRDKGLRSHLWVLDLYFPVEGNVASTPRERDEMVESYARLDKEVRNFRAYLTGIGQGPEGGLALLEKCKQNNVPVVMFTRKGMLDDAINCIDGGAKRVLKKPTPSEVGRTPKARKDALDAAMREQAAPIADRLTTVIQSNSFWRKHRGLIGFVDGIILTALLETAIRYLFGLG